MTTLRILVAPFGRPGVTSTGRVIVSRDGLTWPEDVSRVKLLVDHDRSQPVGVCKHLEQIDEGVVGLFEVPGRSTRIVKLIAEVRAGLRDAASPGIDWDDATLLRFKRAGGADAVKAEGVLREVSLVTVGGFVDSRVLEVAA